MTIQSGDELAVLQNPAVSGKQPKLATTSKNKKSFLPRDQKKR